MRDGGKVVYVGQEDNGPPAGTPGRVLSCTALYGHVQWLEGPLKDQVGIYAADDLAMVGVTPSTTYTTSVSASLTDSLEVGSLVSVASAVQAYDIEGSDGLVAHLSTGGHLAAYASLVEDVMQRLMMGLQDDPVIRQVTAQMDPEEADEVLRKAARLLITDRGEMS